MAPSNAELSLLPPLRQHQEALVRFAYRLVGDLDEASDVAQETFIRAYERIADFRGGSTLYTWLYPIAYNRAISLLRRRRVRRFSKTWPALATTLFGVRSFGASPAPRRGQCSSDMTAGRSS